MDQLNAQLARLAREHFAPDVAEDYVRLARPAVRLQHTTTTSGSWLGGAALVEPGTAWPHWGDRPLALVCVLDVDDLAGLVTDAPLPDRGVLNFFYESEEQQAWGFDPDHRDGWRVIPADKATAELVSAPQGVEHFEPQFLQAGQVLTVSDFEDGPFPHPARLRPGRRRWP